jgi:hypothetical protein
MNFSMHSITDPFESLVKPVEPLLSTKATPSPPKFSARTDGGGKLSISSSFDAEEKRPSTY